MDAELRIFTKGYESHLESLVRNKPEEAKRTYSSPGSRRKSVHDRPENLVGTGVLVPANLFDSIRGGMGSDEKNAHLLHLGLRMTPSMAANGAVWSRLAHFELWNYMQKRWLPNTGLEDKKFALFVDWRYFVKNRNSRRLMRHGVARLWWAAELTKTTDGSYHNTGTLLWLPECAERQYAQYPLVLKTLLDFVESKKRSLAKMGILKHLRQDYFRPLLKKFNHLGGTLQLGQLDRREIMGLLGDSFREIEAAAPRPAAAP